MSVISRGLVSKFIIKGSFLDAQPYGAGNINDTYLVSIKPENGRHIVQHIIVQRINTNVFHEPKHVMANIRVVTDHIQRRISEDENDANLPWTTPTIIRSRDNNDYVLAEDGSYWRALTFIEHAKTYPSITDRTHAREAGAALGRFHELIHDIEISQLYDTLPGFHITPTYLAHFDEVLKRPAEGVDVSSPDAQYCFDCIYQHREIVPILEQASAHGELTMRPIHGDPKVDNILIDNNTHHAIGIIDLDTVKPGLIHYDIGDCLRSCCNLAGENVMNVDDVHFDVDLAKVILEGYTKQAKQFLTPSDFHYLFDAVRLISFELGLRFFTDHLEGDTYFKVRYPGHNLKRALVQLKLAESIEAQESGIRSLTERMAQ